VHQAQHHNQRRRVGSAIIAALLATTITSTVGVGLAAAEPKKPPAPKCRPGQIKTDADGTKYVCDKKGKWIKVLWLQVGGQTVGALATEGVAG
jgi:hypothetical protein